MVSFFYDNPLNLAMYYLSSHAQYNEQPIGSRGRKVVKLQNQGSKVMVWGS